MRGPGLPASLRGGVFAVRVHLPARWQAGPVEALHRSRLQPHHHGRHRPGGPLAARRPDVERQFLPATRVAGDPPRQLHRRHLTRSNCPGLLRLRGEHQRVARRQLHPGLARLVADVGDVDLHGDQFVWRRQPVLARHPAVLHHPGRTELVGVAPAGTIQIGAHLAPTTTGHVVELGPQPPGVVDQERLPDQLLSVHPGRAQQDHPHAQVLRGRIHFRLAGTHGADDVVNCEINPARLVAGGSRVAGELLHRHQHAVEIGDVLEQEERRHVLGEPQPHPVLIERAVAHPALTGREGTVGVLLPHVAVLDRPLGLDRGRPVSLLPSEQPIAGPRFPRPLVAEVDEPPVPRLLGPDRVQPVIRIRGGVAAVHADPLHVQHGLHTTLRPELGRRIPHRQADPLGVAGDRLLVGQRLQRHAVAERQEHGDLIVVVAERLDEPAADRHHVGGVDAEAGEDAADGGVVPREDGHVAHHLEAPYPQRQRFGLAPLTGPARRPQPVQQFPAGQPGAGHVVVQALGVFTPNVHCIWRWNRLAPQGVPAVADRPRRQHDRQRHGCHLQPAIQIPMS